MWIAKIDVHVPEDILWKTAKCFGVTIYVYPIKHYIKNNKVYYVMYCILDGDEHDKKKTVLDLKNNNWTVHEESKGDYLLLVTYRPLNKTNETKQSIFFNPAVIYTKPIKILPTGRIEIVFGSWDKKTISDMLKWCKKYYDFKLISLKHEKTTTIGFFTSFHLLTVKQQQALSLAVKNGYYNYPRNTELKNLAKLMEISFSTYKAHLHKAEQKILPFLIASIK